MASVSNRAKRIPLDYYNRPDNIRRWRYRLGAFFLLVTIGLIAAGINWSSAVKGKLEANSFTKWAANHGQISQVHAAWENQCEKCHVPFSPITSNNVLAYFTALNGQKFSPQTNCTECHQENLDHTAHFSITSEHGCASCHQEHQGRGHRLANVSSQSCTQCHRDLKLIRDELTRSQVNKELSVEHALGWEAISNFSKENHPEFASLSNREDPGTIKFNHQLHMAAGQGFRRDQNKDQLQQGDATTTSSKLHQLKCSTCHQPHGNSGSPVNTAGDFSPITYQQHCKSCHEIRSVATLVNQSTQLSKFIDQQLQKKTGLREELQLLQETQIPHGVQVHQMHRWVKQSIAGLALFNDVRLSEKTDKSITNIPGQKNQQPTQENRENRQLDSSESLTTLKFLNDQVTHVMKQLISVEEKSESCTKCHVYEVINKKTNQSTIHETLDLNAMASSENITLAMESIKIVPANWKHRWFTKAEFHHKPHSRVDCIACHSQAVSKKSSMQTYQLLNRSRRNHQDETDLMIPGIDNCVRCHSPSSQGISVASDSCLLCHDFHNADSQPGEGNLFEQRNTFQNIKDFIQGNSTAD